MERHRDVVRLVWLLSASFIEGRPSIAEVFVVKSSRSHSHDGVVANVRLMKLQSGQQEE